MFRLAKPGEPIKWPVEVHVPRDGGGTTKHTFYAYFVVRSQAEIDALVAEGDAEFFAGVIGGPGWEGVSDEHGQELSFSPQALEQLVAVPYVKSALSTAYWQFVLGAARKNSRLPRGTG
jgi:hypothetical protein